MDDPAVQSPPKSVTSIYPPLVVIAFAIAIYVAARNYSEVARRMPQMVSVTLIVLGLIDLWCRTSLPGSAFMRDFWGASFRHREMTHTPTFRSELVMILWVLGAFAGTAVIGILPALPIFCTLYIWLYTGHSLRTALLISAGLLIFEYVVFEWLLGYELYRGLLFSKGGFSRW